MLSEDKAIWVIAIEIMLSEDKAIWVIAFSGKQIDWTVWEEKFLAKANLKGYKKILLGKEIAPKDSDEYDESSASGLDNKRRREANESAYTDLILSIDGTSANDCVAFNLVHLSKTKDGRAYEINARQKVHHR